MNNLDIQAPQQQQHGSKAELICQLNCKRIYELRRSSGAGAEVDIHLCPINSGPNVILVPAHKIFLRNCPYFKKMLDLNGESANRGPDVREAMEVNCDQETIEAIIKFLYIGELDELDGDNFTKIFRASREFELPDMAKGCLDFCSQNIHLITKNNWLEIYRYILNIMETPYLIGIFDFLHNNISDIIGSNAFLSLTFDELKVILEKTSEVFNTQQEFLLATYNWLSYEYEGSEVRRSEFTTELIKFTWHDEKSKGKGKTPTKAKTEKRKASPLKSRSKSSTASPLKNSHTTNVSSPRIDQVELPQLAIKMEIDEDDYNLPSTSTSASSRIAKAPKIKPSFKKSAGPPQQQKLKKGVQNKSYLKGNAVMNNIKTENILSLDTKFINDEFPLNFEIIFLVESLNDSSPNSLYCYSPRKQYVSKFADLPINNLRDFSMVTTEDKLYILGGLIKTSNGEEDLVRDVYSFDLLLKGEENSSELWTEEPEMILNDAMDMFPTLIDGENAIYMVGGLMDGLSIKTGNFCTDYIEKLDLNEKSEGWKRVHLMTWSRERCAATIFNNKIYISGGSGNKDKVGSKAVHILKSFEVFDIESSTGHNLKQMREDRVDHNLVAYKEEIFALGGYGRKNKKIQSVEVYDPILNTWEPAPSMNYARANSASFVFNDSLYVIGGEEIDVILEKYDYENKIWIEIQTPSIQFPENSEFPSSIALMLPSNETSN